MAVKPYPFYDTQKGDAAVTLPARFCWIPRALCCCIVLLALVRLCHLHLLWSDEDYHIAAAINILHGKMPYRDFWYDKPPLNAAFYLLIGGYGGVALRLLDSAYILLACYLTFRLAQRWWGSLEGWIAAYLLAFSTTFYLPSVVVPFAADALLLVPHLAAIYCAHQRRALLAGAFAAVGFLFNTKALFVLASCSVFVIPELLWLFVGFTIPLLVGFLWAIASGAWPGYCEQVWHWGLLYAKSSPVTRPFWTGVSRTANWLGFHAALASSMIIAFFKITATDSVRLGVWIAFSFAAVCLGARFAPRYFLQLLPPLIIAASRGIVLAFCARPRPAAVGFGILLLIPLIRFGPHYGTLIADAITHREPNWSDVAMDLDSQHVAERLRSLARPGNTLFVWGYRPDIYVYTRMVSDSLFWDSQPLTGVPADRHLSVATAIDSGAAAANRVQLAHSRPTFIVDGLSLLNPKLNLALYPELRPWLQHYRLVARTKLSLIYELEQ